MSCMKANAYTHNNNEQMPTESPHSLCNPRFSSPICLASVYTPCGLAGPWLDLHWHSGGDVMQTTLRNSVLSAHSQTHNVGHVARRRSRRPWSSRTAQFASVFMGARQARPVPRSASLQRTGQWMLGTSGVDSHVKRSV